MQFGEDVSRSMVGHFLTHYVYSYIFSCFGIESIVQFLSNIHMKLVWIVQGDVEEIISKLISGDVQLCQLWKWIGNILSIVGCIYTFDISMNFALSAWLIFRNQSNVQEKHNILWELDYLCIQICRYIFLQIRADFMGLIPNFYMCIC